MIADAVRVKARIVERDPYEMGDRAWLNLGHTFGHALELLSSYTLRHGDAVALGMIAAAEMSAALGYCDAALPPHAPRPSSGWACRPATRSTRPRRWPRWAPTKSAAAGRCGSCSSGESARCLWRMCERKSSLPIC